MVPPLPYRPLEVRGHGVYDPYVGRFYPFVGITTSATIPAKPGIAYFVSFFSVSAHNTGDHVASYVSWNIVQGGITRQCFRVIIPSTTAASGIDQGVAVCSPVALLCDPNTPITLSSSASSSICCVTYAEIPVDEGEV